MGAVTHWRNEEILAHMEDCGIGGRNGLVDKDVVPASGGSPDMPASVGKCWHTSHSAFVLCGDAPRNPGLATQLSINAIVAWSCGWGVGG